jgi:hypothetical protein
MFSLFLLFTLPGLVVIITLVGMYKLIKSKITGKPINGSSTTGLDILDQAFRPTSQYRIQEEKRKKNIGQNYENDDPKDKKNSK